MFWRILLFVLGASLLSSCRSDLASAQAETELTHEERLEAADIKILFVGNSHTATHNVPVIVRELLESAKADRVVATHYVGSSTLKYAWNDNTKEIIRSGGWDYIVLQGQEISMSHKYDYSKAEAISLAKLGIESGAKVLLFSEWKRRNIEETEYIEAIYRHIAKESGAEVVPIGRAWDRALKQKPKLELWSGDGNHSQAAGAYLAAATIACWIAEEGAPMKKGREPIQLSEDDAHWLLAVARDEVISYRQSSDKTDGP